MIVFLMQETIEKTYSTAYEEQFFFFFWLDNKVYIFRINWSINQTQIYSRVHLLFLSGSRHETFVCIYSLLVSLLVDSELSASFESPESIESKLKALAMINSRVW
jgi:hypothetical protein